MQRILLCALGLVGAATSAAVPGSTQAVHQLGIRRAFESPVEWDVRAFPDGPLLTLTGTVQQVRAQLVAINPNYTSDFPGTGSGLQRRKKTKGQSNPEYHAGPGGLNPGSVNCDSDRWGTVGARPLMDGITYLDDLPEGSKPRIRGGPAACSQVSCSWDTAIWWCNDSKQPKTLDSWHLVADGANYLSDTCTPEKNLNGYLSGGQIFSSDNWNVIVSKGNC